MMEEKPANFTYTYSAMTQEEVKRIREKYLTPTPEEEKLERLRHLDRDVTKLGTVIAIIVGVIGALTMGIGMSCTMVWADKLFFLGIIIGLIGIAIIGSTYPLYVYITKKQRRKIAPEIIRLTDELMK